MIRLYGRALLAAATCASVGAAVAVAIAVRQMSKAIDAIDWSSRGDTEDYDPGHLDRVRDQLKIDPRVQTPKWCVTCRVRTVHASSHGDDLCRHCLDGVVLVQISNKNGGLL